GRAQVPDEWVAAIAEEFEAGRCDDEQTAAEIAAIHERTGLLIDPHTAVGLHVARHRRRDPSMPMITLATADPAKFPDAVAAATGQRPDLPPFLSELFTRTERFEVVANDLSVVADHLRSLRAR
ncbi:MAG: threonine synthase, partial [Actinomycetota bacterium]